MKVLLHSIILQLLCVCVYINFSTTCSVTCSHFTARYLFLWGTLQWQGYIVAKHTNSTEGTR